MHREGAGRCLSRCEGSSACAKASRLATMSLMRRPSPPSACSDDACLIHGSSSAAAAFGRSCGAWRVRGGVRPELWRARGARRRGGAFCNNAAQKAFASSETHRHSSPSNATGTSTIRRTCRRHGLSESDRPSEAAEAGAAGAGRAPSPARPRGGRGGGHSAASRPPLRAPTCPQRSRTRGQCAACRRRHTR